MFENKYNCGYLRVLFLRSGYGKPDSRLEKELVAVIDNNEVNVCAWDRNSDKDVDHILTISGYDFLFHHIGIKSVLAAGFKKNLLPMLRFNVKIYKYLKHFGDRYDVVHVSDFDTALPAYLLKKKKKYKLVYDIYDYYADSHHMPGIVDKLVRHIDTKVINNSDVTIICNEKRKQQLIPAKPKKLCIIHNSPENMDVTPDYLNYPRNDKVRLVFVGALSATGRYIKEMVDVIKNRKDVELIIGGFGYKPMEEFLRSVAKSYENISFIGKQEYRKVLEIEATADVLTALYDPSLKNHQYAAPNKFYEGLMLGKPIICAQNTCIDEIVQKYNIGWVLDVPKNTFEDEFNKTLDNAIENIEQLPGYKNRMKAIYNEEYNWDVMKERLKQLYASL